MKTTLSTIIGSYAATAITDGQGNVIGYAPDYQWICCALLLTVALVFLLKGFFNLFK